jgi:two-component system response regulator QseB
MKVLLVEDNEKLSGLVAGHLRARGFAVETAATGAGALDAAGRAAFGVMILDLGLPDMDGLDVLRTIRSESGNDMPTLILTARDSIAHRVGGLDAGADDYILKPFDLLELEARVRAVLRRPGRRQDPVHQFEDLRFDTGSRTAWSGDHGVDLTPREITVFEELIRAGSRIVVRDVLAERLYGAGEDVSQNALDAIVSRLRKKLAACGSAVHIETLRGVGYRLGI